MEPSIAQTLVQLIAVLGQLLSQLLTLGVHWLLFLMWIAWWLFAVNWQKAWPVLARGGWAPLVLLSLIVALAWSSVLPGTCDCIGVVVPNFWWQLGYVGLFAAIAFFCGWLQGKFHCTPPEINLDPPAVSHTHGHGHGHAHHG